MDVLGVGKRKARQRRRAEEEEEEVELELELEMVVEIRKWAGEYDEIHTFSLREEEVD